jgi:protein arginine N-methyltransferase 5
MADRIIVGYRCPHVTNIHQVLTTAQEIHKVEFVVIPLFHNRLRRDKHTHTSDSRSGPRTRSDRELSCKEWSSNVLGEVSSWIDLCSQGSDNSNNVRASSEHAFREEIAWAAHLSLQAVLCPMPRFDSVSQVGNYARCLLQSFQSSPYLQYWIRIPIVRPLLSCGGSGSQQQQGANSSDDGWHVWNHLRTLTGHSHRIAVVLELSNDLPCCTNDSNTNSDSNNSESDADTVDMQLIQRWAAEPVKALIIPTHLFLTNKKGFPVLSKTLQSIINVFLRFRVHIIFTGKPMHCIADQRSSGRHSNGDDDGSISDASYVPYTQYIQFLRTRLRETMTEAEKSMQPYNDTLQSPLQVC